MSTINAAIQVATDVSPPYLRAGLRHYLQPA